MNITCKNVCLVLGFVNKHLPRIASHNWALYPRILLSNHEAGAPQLSTLSTHPALKSGGSRTITEHFTQASCSQITRQSHHNWALYPRTSLKSRGRRTTTEHFIYASCSQITRQSHHNWALYPRILVSNHEAVAPQLSTLSTHPALKSRGRRTTTEHFIHASCSQITRQAHHNWALYQRILLSNHEAVAPQHVWRHRTTRRSWVSTPMK